MTHGRDSHAAVSRATSGVRTARWALWLLAVVTAIAASGCIGGPQPLPPEQSAREVPVAGVEGMGGSDASVQSGASGSGPAIDQRDAGVPCDEGSLDGGADAAASCLPASDDDAGVTSM